MTKKGVGLRILAMGVDTATPTGRLMLNVIGSVAQFEREVMLESLCEGIAKAKGEGRYKGRAPTARVKAADIVRLAAEGVKREEIAARTSITRAVASRRRPSRCWSRRCAIEVRQSLVKCLEFELPDIR